MRQTTIHTIANSKFRGFTMTDLDKRHVYLSNIIMDPSSSSNAVRIAAQEREEVEMCIFLFIDEEVDDPRATPADILEVITGKSLVKLQKQTPGGILAQDLVEKTVVASKATSQVTKNSLHSFGNWLANKTNTQGGN